MSTRCPGCDNRIHCCCCDECEVRCSVISGDECTKTLAVGLALASLYDVVHAYINSTETDLDAMVAEVDRIRDAGLVLERSRS